MESSVTISFSFWVLSSLVVAVCAAAVAAEELEAVVTAETLGAETEALPPELVPPAEMLAEFTTWMAARLILPETRMPASPASMMPEGAMRSTSPGSTPLTVARTPMPPPVARPARSVWTEALCGSMTTRVGGADWTVREEEPAAMSPFVDQMSASPPRRVKIRPMPISTL